MATHWFSKVMGEESPPVSASALKAMARSGMLGRNDLVRRNPDGEWVRAENVIGLFDAPALSVVVEKSIAVVDGLESKASAPRFTQTITHAVRSDGSIEIASQSRQARTRGSHDATFRATQQDPTPDRGLASRAVVPRRTVKKIAAPILDATSSTVTLPSVELDGVCPYPSVDEHFSLHLPARPSQATLSPFELDQQQARAAAAAAY